MIYLCYYFPVSLSCFSYGVGLLHVKQKVISFHTTFLMLHLSTAGLIVPTTHRPEAVCHYIPQLQCRWKGLDPARWRRLWELVCDQPGTHPQNTGMRELNFQWRVQFYRNACSAMGGFLLATHGTNPFTHLSSFCFVLLRILFCTHHSFLSFPH